VSQPNPRREVRAVWVSSEVAADGAYVVGVSIDEDTMVPLSDPVRYATAVVEAAALAEYDAAILSQLSKLGTPIQVCAHLVHELREARPPRDVAALAPFGFEPGVSMRTRKGFLLVSHNGVPFGQWDVADAEGHAVQVLGAAAVVGLDRQYRDALERLIGLDEPTALRVVGDLAQFREGVR
jgi:hypothetical protein